MKRHGWVAAAVLAVLAVGPAAGLEDFSFWQFSDTHAPVRGSGEVIKGAIALAQTGVRLAPDDRLSPPPAFAIVTGDLTEFGPGDGAWETFCSWFAGFGPPLYVTPGNHDNTWWLLRPLLGSSGRCPPYAFSYGGCRFILLDSAGRQDPRPGFALEQLRWLEEELARTDPATPLFVAFHHPTSGSEWSSAADWQRVLERLQGHNVAALLVGHGHSAAHFKLGDFDAVEGGSTFDKNAPGWAGGNAGFAVWEVRGGILRVVYKRHSEAQANALLLEKSLAPPEPLPTVRFETPTPTLRPDSRTVAVVLDFAGAAGATGTVTLDDGPAVPLQRRGRQWTAELALEDDVPGRHFLRVRFEQDGRVALASREVARPLSGAARARWRTMLGGSVRGAPLVGPGGVYVAAQDGVLYALEQRTGRIRWTVATDGELLGGPASDGQLIVVGTTGGTVLAVGPDGGERWRAVLDAPIVAPVTIAAGVALVATVDGHLVAFEAATGSRRWQVKAAEYTIESAPAVAGDRVVIGAWDTFVRALGLVDGREHWRAVGEGSRAGAAARYYSPADAPPVVAGGRVYAADRAYKLIVLDASNGERLSALDQVVAVAASPSGQAVYLRRMGKDGGRVTKLDAVGQEVWTVAVPTGYLPSPPACDGRQVVVVSSNGLVSALADADGRLLWQYRATAGFWVPGGAVLDGDTVYVAGADGAVTAIVPPTGGR